MKPLLILSTILVACFTAVAANTTERAAEYSKLILGRWAGPRKINVYHADGTWGVQRNEEAREDKKQRRWSIKGNQLTITFPGEHGTSTATLTIRLLTAQELILEVSGNKQHFERLP